ncbi:MAG: protease inhibitor I42 family protein [Hyphomonadaceae bacterium]
MRIAVLMLAGLLCACATPAEESANPVQHSNSQSLPPPIAETVSVRIGAEQNGQNVRVNVGQTFAVALVGVPTAGYVWQVKERPAFLEAAGEASGNTSAAQSQPGFAGGSHWEVFNFRATQAGSGALTLEQRRPWETNEPPAQTFAVTIEAQ